MARNHINPDFRKYLSWTLIPIGVGIPLWITNINFVVSTSIIITASFMLYIRYRLVTIDETHDIIYVVFPHSLAKDIYPYFARIISKLSSGK